MDRTLILLLVLCAPICPAHPAHAQSRDPVKIGLAAAISGESGAAGEAIRRGIQIAMDEVNAKGGVLGGRKLELVIRDDEGNPAQGVAIARELIQQERTVTVFGGLHIPLALAIEQAQAAEGPKIGDALENLKAEHRGLINT